MRVTRGCSPVHAGSLASGLSTEQQPRWSMSSSMHIVTVPTLRQGQHSASPATSCGACPWASSACGSAPAASSLKMMPGLPMAAAVCRGVYPRKSLWGVAHKGKRERERGSSTLHLRQGVRGYVCVWGEWGRGGGRDCGGNCKRLSTHARALYSTTEASVAAVMGPITATNRQNAPLREVGALVEAAAQGVVVRHARSIPASP